MLFPSLAVSALILNTISKHNLAIIISEELSWFSLCQNLNDTISNFGLSYSHSPAQRLQGGCLFAHTAQLRKDVGNLNGQSFVRQASVGDAGVQAISGGPRGPTWSGLHSNLTPHAQGSPIPLNAAPLDSD
jgi:hypothetical protein